MARTSLNAPAHRVMQRMPLGTSQPPFIAPSFDAVGAGIQDARLPWNTGGASSSVPQVVGWYDGAGHPVLDVVPATASVVNISAAAVPTSGVPLTLVNASGSGVVISTSPQLMLPALTTLPTGTLFIGAQPVYETFGNVGSPPQTTVAYDAGTMLGRAVSIHSVGNDSGATVTVVGWDIYGYLTHATLTMATAGNTVTTTKTFIAIQSITPNGTLSGSNVSAGVSDVFGLPFYASAQSAIWGFFNNAIIQGVGTFVAGVTTSPATALTGDVRGTYAPGASDGTKRLTLWQHPSLARMIAAGINVGMFGVAQF